MEVKPGYKLTDVGIIPEEWEVKRLADTVDFLDGRRRPVKDSDRAKMRGDIPYYGASGIVDYVNDFLFNEDLILLGEDGENILSRNCRLAFKISGKTWVNNHAHVLKPKAGMSLDYLAEFLESRDYAQYNTGTAQPKLNKAVCSDIPVVCPPAPEQRAIAEALSDADALLAALDQLIAKKRDLKQAAMQQLLTGSTRLPGFRDKWEVKLLGDLFNFSGGYSASRDQLSTEGHCYLHYGDIHKSSKTFIDVRADNQDIPKLDIPLTNVSSSSLLDDGDVVFVDASEDDEGTSKHVVVVNKDKKPFISGLHTIVAKARTDELAHEYRRYCFQTAAIRQQFLFYAVGTKVSGISKTNIVKLTLPVPSVPEQIAIAGVLADMEAELAALEQRRAKTRVLKQGMMQELLTGRTRLVSPVTNIIPLLKPEHVAAAKSPSHNWQINEAVIIGALARQFGTEQWPLPRKRRVKLTYLLHRHAEGKAVGFLKKAAGPYNPATKYKGPEAIALKNNYVREHNNGTYPGFVAAGNVTQAEKYFAEWYPGASAWLERFRFEKTDELELLSTVDMAMEDLRSNGGAVDLGGVKDVIRNHPEWEAKLSRPIFADSNIARAIKICCSLFA